MQTFQELYEDNLSALNLRKGSILTGVISGVKSNYYLIHVGLKSDARVAKYEFEESGDPEELNVGDETQVALITPDNGLGETIVSRELVSRITTWQNLEEAHKNNDTVSGIIRGRIRGGFAVEFNSVRAFLPGSLVDIRPLYDISHIENIPLDFKVIKCDRATNNVVVSRRVILLESMQNDRDGLLAKIQEGGVYDGTIKNIQNYGAFVDLGGIDGLLHISEIEWKHVSDPHKVLTIGQTVKVKVLSFDKEQMRISLGMKQLTENPWDKVAELCPIGSIHEGIVSRLQDFGCFVDLGNGFEGLVHNSQMDWLNPKPEAASIVSVGEKIKVKVLDVDLEKEHVSLGMKQCLENPWELFAKDYNPGDKLTGKIQSITDFGIFVGLEYGMDGLVHINDISWNQPGVEATKEYSQGDTIEVVLLQIDVSRERISLGIKQLTPDVFEEYSKANKVGDEVTAIVEEISPHFAKLTIKDHPQVFANLAVGQFQQDERTEDLTRVLNLGEEIVAAIRRFDYKQRIVDLTIAGLEREQSQTALKEHREEVEKGRSQVTLGDIAGTALEDLKKSQEDSSTEE